jgi:crotonobetaine/carnitine-CoA ligase
MDAGVNPPPRCSNVRADAPAGVAELLFTSGTTSRPKAVMMTDAAFLHGAGVLAAAAGYGVSDVPLITLSLFHAAAQTHQLWPTLLLGGRIVLVERFSASGFAAQAARHGATTSAQFAASLRMLLRRGSPQPEGMLRHITFAQSLTDDEYADWESTFGIPLQQLWGMTETVGLPIMSPLTGDRRLDAIGKVVAGYEIDVRTASGPISGAKEELGELVVRADPGRTVTLGYFRDPPATAALLHDGWLWSGDIVRRSPDGFVYFVGRHGDIIRRAGVNFSALEVEEVIRSVPGVIDAAVVGLPDPIHDQRVVAAIVVAHYRDDTVDAIHAQCAEALAAYKRPEALHFVDELPRTSVGKIRRHVLAAELAAAAAPELPSSA